MPAVTARARKETDTSGSRPDRNDPAWIARNLLWVGMVTLLVGGKLLLSCLVPGLRTAGELVPSGALLLAMTVSVFRIRVEAATPGTGS